MSSKRMKVIQTRPEPPNVDSVRNDLENTPSDDVVFTFFRSVSKEGDSVSASVKSNLPRSPSSSNTDSNKDYLKSSLAMELTSPASSTVYAKTRASDLAHCYDQTLKFIQMNEYLKDSQDRLADQCSELQDLGQAVKEQVESLRTQLS